jgi:hypothetical protein
LGTKKVANKHTPKGTLEKEIASNEFSLLPIFSELVEGIYIRPVTISILIPMRNKLGVEWTLTSAESGPTIRSSSKKAKIRAYFKLTAHDLSRDRSASQVLRFADLQQFQQILIDQHNHPHAVQECFQPQSMHWWCKNIKQLVGVFDRPTGQLVVMVNRVVLKDRVARYVENYNWMTASISSGSYAPDSEEDMALYEGTSNIAGNSLSSCFFGETRNLNAPADTVDDVEAAIEPVGKLWREEKDGDFVAQLDDILDRSLLNVQTTDYRVSPGSSTGSSPVLPEVGKRSPMQQSVGIFSSSEKTSPKARPCLYSPKSTRSPGSPWTPGGSRVNKRTILRSMKPSIITIPSGPTLPQLLTPSLPHRLGTPTRLSERTSLELESVYGSQEDIYRLHQLKRAEWFAKEANRRFYDESKRRFSPQSRPQSTPNPRSRSPYASPGPRTPVTRTCAPTIIAASV